MLTISEFYLNELEQWKPAIQSRLQSVSGMEERLQIVIDLNTVTNPAASIENYLNRLLQSKFRFLQLEDRIEEMEIELTSPKAVASYNGVLFISVNDNLILNTGQKVSIQKMQTYETD